MAFLMQQVLGGKLKNMMGGGESANTSAADGKDTPESKGMSREEFEEYQRQLVEEKIQRDKEFATKKAERANLRVLLRDKYRIPQNAQDDATVQMAGDDLDVPEDLAKMVDEDEEQEEMNDSFMGKLQNLDLDFDAMKIKAQSTMTEVKQAAEEKCVLM
ncbi:complexin-4c [Brachyhypopomus gauderio]|uniref:complexin-4c n=1 Tax=Brachyhypopomus gauderio TaxID=698409 RepID=UPI00404301BF